MRAIFCETHMGTTASGTLVAAGVACPLSCYKCPAATTCFDEHYRCPELKRDLEANGFNCHSDLGKVMHNASMNGQRLEQQCCASCSAALPCTSRPCHAGGTCQDTSTTTFRCHCPANWGGPICKEDLQRQHSATTIVQKNIIRQCQRSHTPSQWAPLDSLAANNTLATRSVPSVDTCQALCCETNQCQGFVIKRKKASSATLTCILKSVGASCGCFCDDQANTSAVPACSLAQRLPQCTTLCEQSRNNAGFYTVTHPRVLHRCIMQSGLQSYDSMFSSLQTMSTIAAMTEYLDPLGAPHA